MDLHLLRHAIAETVSECPTGKDSDRRLTDEGREKMREIAAGMLALELSFDLVLSSPYARARQTAEIVAETFDCKKLLKISQNLTPDGDAQKLIDELNGACKNCKSVLLVGHEPFMSSFISLLVFGDGGGAINMKKGGLAKISVEALSHGDCGVLEWLMAPRLLRKIG